MEAIFLKFTFFTFIPLSIIAVLISNNRTFSIFYKGYHKYAIIRRDCKLKYPISGLLHVFALSTGYDLQIMTVFNIELQADMENRGLVISRMLGSRKSSIFWEARTMADSFFRTRFMLLRMYSIVTGLSRNRYSSSRAA